MSDSQSKLFDIWSKKWGVILENDITPEQWTAIQEAAKFKGVSGRRASEIVSGADGALLLIDTCDGVHRVDQLLFYGVKP